MSLSIDPACVAAVGTASGTVDARQDATAYDPVALPLDVVTLRRSEVQANPYPFYQRLRAEDPVHWQPAPRPLWTLSRYSNVLAALKDPRLSAQRPWDPSWLPEASQGTVRSVQQAYRRQVLFLDALDHTRL